MSKLFRYIMLLGPLLVFALLAGNCSLSRSRVESRAAAADGLEWSQGDRKVSVDVETRQEGTVVHYDIRARDEEGGVLFERQCEIDLDGWLQGFVIAEDFDGDGEPEILAWIVEGGDFVLDFQEGRIVETPLEEMPLAVKQRALKLSNDVLGSSAKAFMAGALLVPYYLIFAVAAALSGWRRQRKEERESPSEGEGLTGDGTIVENEDGSFSVYGKTFARRADAEEMAEFVGRQS